MAKLNKTSEVKNLGNGILMPQMSYRWRIQFTGENVPFTDTERNIFGLQMVGCSVDYKSKTLSLIIEQDKETTHLHDMVKKLTVFADNTVVTDNISFKLDMLNGNSDIQTSFQFDSCSLVAHSFDLNYGDSATAKHKIKLLYKNTEEV